MLLKTNIVSSQWLKDNINKPELIVLFTQMDKPVTGKTDSAPIDYIPYSIFFDFTVLPPRAVIRK